MLTAQQEVEGLIAGQILASKAAAIRSADYSNRYTVLAVDPESRQQVAKIRVNIDGFKVHYWINQDNPGYVRNEEGARATVGDARSMEELVNELALAITEGFEELANG